MGNLHLLSPAYLEPALQGFPIVFKIIPFNVPREGVTIRG